MWKHSPSLCFLFGNPADHLTMALWLCVPGLLRVCPFGGSSRYSIALIINSLDAVGKAS